MMSEFGIPLDPKIQLTCPLSTDDDLWNISSDRDAWIALRPITGQADQ